MQTDTSLQNAAATGTKPLLHGRTRAEIAEWCRTARHPSYRADQLWKWLYVQRAADWPEMTNLPGPLRRQLDQTFSMQSGVPLRVRGRSGQTRKILVGLADGETVEEVLIPAPRRRTVCVSSQVGCRFRCAFCASGQAGFRRNLAAGEIVGQILLAARVTERPLTHVVFMGIGEPLDNYDAVLRAVRIANDRDGLGIGARRITISTCGLVPGIERLAAEGLQVELSVSLHAARNELRSRLMPVNRRYPLEGLLAACRAYAEKTRRIVTFEYTLIRGVNDSAAHARPLAERLSDLPCRVNLIPLSPVAEYEGRPAAPGAATRFIEILLRAGIHATLRASKGTPLRAACGQLRCATGTGPRAAGDGGTA